MVKAEPVPVRLNQVGIQLGYAKLAIVPDPSTKPLRWELIDSAGREVASGMTVVFGNDRSSGEHLHRVDFSGWRRSGAGFRIRLGQLASRPFDISGNVYARLPYDALAYFYHNRAGTPIDGRLVGARWARPAGHVTERATCLSKIDANGNKWPGCSYTLDVTGGWYDAGDHGKYVVNGGIALWTLLNIAERQRLDARPEQFADKSASIPESGNGISDLLDEARWEMEFLLRMQVPEGSKQFLPQGAKRNVRNLIFTATDTSGMAHHKVADENWTTLPTRPDLDRERRQLFPPSTGATLNLAAAAAQCARIWRAVDRRFSDRCLRAAEKAWVGARRNPAIYAIADFPGSGGYGDDSLEDEFYWAAAELFATTRKAEYKIAVERSSVSGNALGAEPGWGSVAPLGAISLMLNRSGISLEQQQKLKKALVSTADRFVSDAADNGYAVSLPKDLAWGSTSSLLNRAMILALAHDLTKDPRYADGVNHAMDFILGRNALDRSFVTGYGARPVQQPHHRFWAQSLDPTYPPTPAGALSGGPNNTNMSDDVAAAMKGKCAPQKCWADDIRAFSLNEVAINWNAPLVWVASWLSATEARSPRTAK